MDWKNVIERALWTAAQTPGAVAVIDAISTKVEVPSRDLVLLGLIGFAISAIKTIGQERLAYLKARGNVDSGESES